MLSHPLRQDNADAVETRSDVNVVWAEYLLVNLRGTSPHGFSFRAVALDKKPPSPNTM